MSLNTVSALEIPQGATELSLDELKQISGGHENDNKHDKGFKVKKIIKIIIFEKRKNRHHEDNDDDNNCDN